MAITRLGSTDRFVEIVNGTGAAGNLAAESGWQAGDLDLIAVSWYDNGPGATLSTPSGYTRAGSADYTLIDASTKATLFYKVLDGTEGASSIQFSAAAYANAVRLTLRGASALEIVAGSFDPGTAANGTTVTSPDIAGSAGQMLLCPMYVSDPATFSTPADMTAGPWNSGAGTDSLRWFYQALSADAGSKSSTLSITRNNRGFALLAQEPAAGGDGSASGTTLTATASIVAGAASANAQAGGATLSASASAIAGSAAGGAGAAGVTLAASASIVAGSASGAAAAAGVTLGSSASLVAGAPSVSVSASGAVLSQAASLLAGSASASADGAASGTTLAASATLLGGNASGTANATASGATVSATASVLAGTASASGNATANGVTLTAAASLLGGSAAGAAQAGGSTLAASVTLQAGTASGSGNAAASGVTLSAVATLSAGSASAANDGTAVGTMLAHAASLLPGSASGTAAGSGATVVAIATLLAGSAANDAVATGLTPPPARLTLDNTGRAVARLGARNTRRTA